MEWGIFNDESADWTEAEAVEAGFYSREEAEEAVRDRYTDDDDLTVHEVEEAEDDELAGTGYDWSEDNEDNDPEDDE